jgi:hypothetical protein
VETSTALTPHNGQTAPSGFDYLPPVDQAAVARAILIGDISKMDAETCQAYYVATCRSIGLNPLTRPLQALMSDDGTVRFYYDKSCAEQLRKLARVSTRVVSRETHEGLYIVTIEARTPDGRTEEAQGIVPLVRVKGTWETFTTRQGATKRYFKAELDAQGHEIVLPMSHADRANAMMRCETKAKRRVTLAICGLGFSERDGEGEHPMALPRPAPPDPAPTPADQDVAPVSATEALFGEARDPLVGAAEDARERRETVEHAADLITETIRGHGGTEAVLTATFAWAEKHYQKPLVEFSESEWQDFLARVQARTAQERRTAPAPDGTDAGVGVGEAGTWEEEGDGGQRDSGGGAE